MLAARRLLPLHGARARATDYLQRGHARAGKIAAGTCGPLVSRSPGAAEGRWRAQDD